MKYYYAYRDKFGKRYTDSMEAKSREEVFVALRKVGIRAIKVTASDGSKANGEIRKGFKGIAFATGLVTLAFAILLLAMYVTKSKQESPQRNYSASDALVLKDMLKNAGALKGNFNSRLSELQPIDLGDFSCASNVSALAEETNRVVKALDLVSVARLKSKIIFRSLPNLLELDSDAARDAQIEYGRWIGELDACESALNSRFGALKLLMDMKREWRYTNGKISFRSIALESQFKRYTEMLNVDAQTSRWHHDFVMPGNAETTGGSPKAY